MRLTASRGPDRAKLLLGKRRALTRDEREQERTDGDEQAEEVDDRQLERACLPAGSNPWRRRREVRQLLPQEHRYLRWGDEHELRAERVRQEACWGGGSGHGNFDSPPRWDARHPSFGGSRSHGPRRREMRARGLEPPRALAQRVLNPSRLPVPPHPRRYPRISRGRFEDSAAG